MACLYPFYVETFFAAGAALRRNDEEWLASIRYGAGVLEGERAWVAELAMTDAASGSPVRARIRVCRAFVSEHCAAGQCPQSDRPDRLVR